jgi:hypothetical protein
MKILKYKKNCKSEVLEWGGIIIILLTIVVVGASLVSKINKNSNNDYINQDITNISKIEYFEIDDKKNIDSTQIALSEEFIKTINSTSNKINKKVEELNKISLDLKEIQKENIENFRFYLTLLGFIFAIVGFFGFKSIFDTRQAAIERAVFEAKVSAEKKAIEISELESRKASENAKNVAKEDVKIHAKNEVELYLNDNLKKHIVKLESDLVKDFEERIKIVELNINKLSRPESFNELERPQIFNLINEQLLTLNNEVNNLNKEIFDFKNEELKRSIISELKKG